MCHRATERLKTSHNMRMLCIVLVGVYITFPGLLAWADTVYLKDGRILRDCRATQNGNTWAIEKGGATINLPTASVQKVDKSETRSAEAASEDKATAETTSTQDNTAATGRDLHYDYKLAEDLESMVVPDASYPDGECKIWTPTEKARSEYINRTIFVPSSVAKEGRKFASVDDVVRDKSQFGYFFSTLPPQFVPVIDYPEDDKPIYSFVGQMVPGTNVKYTNPEIPAAWLVDVAEVDGKEVTVPALTTIDFHNFRSINWPRERYMKAIERAREGRANRTISGKQRRRFERLEGVVRVTGDYGLSDSQGLQFTPGTAIIMNSNKDDNNIWEGKNKIQLKFDGRIGMLGTAQKPIIFTVDANKPEAQNWFGINLEKNTQGNISYSIVEYSGRQGVGLFFCSRRIFVNNNIIRYGFLEQDHIESSGILIQNTNCIVKNNEIHHHLRNIGLDSDSSLIMNNIIYSPNADIKILSNSIKPFKSKSKIYNNTLIDSKWAIEIGLGKPEIMNNIITDSMVGILFYTRDGPQSPNVNYNNVCNNQWGNYGEEKEAGKWKKTTPNGINNISLNPNFINPNITDFRLHPTSPCIDAGREFNYLKEDFEGKIRDKKPDIGAYEIVK